jgi:hypothetical protein
MSVAIEKLTKHFLSSSESGPIELEYSTGMAAIDSGMADSLVRLSKESAVVLGETPIRIQSHRVATKIPVFPEFRPLESLFFPGGELFAIPPQPQEIALHVRPIEPPPDPKRHRVGGGGDIPVDEAPHFGYWTLPDTIGMRRVDSRPSRQRKKNKIPLASAKIRTGNLRGTRTVRSLLAAPTPERVSVEGTFLWSKVPYTSESRSLPARAEFWNAFGSVWFELHLALPEADIALLAKAIDWPASTHLQYVHPEFVYCSHEQILHRLEVGLNFRTGFRFGPNLQRAVQSDIGRMELVGTATFSPRAIALNLESSPLTMYFGGGKVILSNAALRVTDRGDFDACHLMNLTGLLHIGSIPPIRVWSPLPPDGGFLCLKSLSTDHWSIAKLDELASFAGESTDWFNTLRRLPKLFDHLTKRDVYDVAVTVDVPSGQISDISFTLFGDQVEYGLRDYVAFTNVNLTWSIFNPLNPARRSHWQNFSATLTLFGIHFDVAFTPVEMWVEGGLIHPPEDDPPELDPFEDEIEMIDAFSETVEVETGLPHCIAAVQTILNGVDELDLECLETVLNSSRGAPFVDVTILFDPFTDRIRLTGLTANGAMHAWEF